MTIRDRLRYLFKALSLSDPKAWDRSLWNLIGSQSLSGENVTEETALTYSAFWSAVTLISGTIRALPLHLMQKKEDKRRIADDRRAYFLMHDKWNKYMTAEVGREVLMMHVLTWGNGYAEQVRNGYGEVVELWPIHPNRVFPEIKEGELVYRIKVERGGDIYLLREKVLHVTGPSPDGFLGYSIVALARKSIGLGMAMETFGSLYFGQGTHPSAVVSHPHQVKDVKAMREAISQVYSGLGKSHQLMLLEDGMKIEKVGIPPEDSQFLESRQFQIPEIARWFNLPPHKLKDLTRSSFSNIESEQISFVTDSILPWLVRLESNYNMQLLTDGDRGLYGGGRLYFKHNVDGLLRADVAARSAFYTAMLDRGVFSINEVRELEDKDPIDGGDVHMVQQNMTTLENIGEELDQLGRKLLPLKPKKKEEEEEEMMMRANNLRRITR